MTADHRSRPRRRGELLEAVILEAVIAELDQRGYADFSIDGVARRAGVGKASLYRRWAGKIELIVDAVYRTVPAPDAVTDTGSLRDDLVAALTGIAQQLAGPAGAALRGILSDALREQRIAEELRSHSQGRGLATIRTVVQRAAARGEVDAEALTRAQLEVGIALVRQRFLLHGSVPAATVVEIVDEIVMPVFRSAGDVRSAGEL